MKTRKLNILMNGILVGQLEKKANTQLVFTYDKKWLKTPGARSISLSMPLIQQQYKGDLVYNFFDNLLPDNSHIRSKIQAMFQAKTNQPFDLLEYIGSECVGALQMTLDEKTLFEKTIKCVPLTENEIANILRGYQNSPLGMTTHDEFRISIAGAQEKTAFLYYKKKWHRPLSTTPTSHIFKLPIGFIQHQKIDLGDSCENEWLCTQIAAAFKLPVAKCKILSFEDVKILAVERFDRKLSADKKWIMRLPQEDMCQALGISPNLKYQSEGGPGIIEIMHLLLNSQNAAEDRDVFFKSQILFWLLAAMDGHAKNFSLFLEPDNHYRLTPLYDIMSAYPLIAKNQLQKQKIKMAMALHGKNNHYHWDKVQRRYFLETAKAAHYSVERAEVLLNAMLEKVENVIKKVSDQLPKGFPKEISQPIFQGMRAVKEKLS